MQTFTDYCKESSILGMEQFLKSLSHVPDDKLNWTPVPETKSAIRIAAHTAITAGNFARMMRERRLPSGDEIADFIARQMEAEEALTDRVEAEGLFRRNTDEVLAALETLTPDEVGITLESSMGWSMPMTFLMQLPGIHAFTHTGQIDFLQTCWGDSEIHIRRAE